MTFHFNTKSKKQEATRKGGFFVLNDIYNQYTLLRHAKRNKRYSKKNDT
jgi:hypothetical protein